MNNKRDYLLLVLTISLFFISCNHSRKDKFSIIGRWKLDTIYQTGKYSDTFQRMITAMLIGGDKNRYRYSFRKDSLLNRLSPKDSTTDKYYIKDSTIFIQSGWVNVRVFDPQQLRYLNENEISLQGKDSVVFILKRE